MSELVANINRTIDITNTAPPAPVGPATPNIIFTDTLASKADAPDGDDILIEKITGIPTGCTLPSYTFVSGVMVDMLATAVKTKCDGKAVMREGDKTTCIGGFTLTASPFTPIACACDVEITDAGQANVKAE